MLDRLKHYYSEALAHNPGVFVFGAVNHILDWVVRRITDEFGDEETLSIVIRRFCRRFESSFPTILKDLYRDVEPRTFQDEFDSQDYGSLRYWMEHLQIAGQEIIQSDAGGPQEFDDFKHYRVPRECPLPQSHEAIGYLDHEIRWSRFPQAWNNTFHEFPSKMTDSTQSTYAPDHDKIIDLALTWIIEPSVVNSIRYPKVPHNRHFPGKLTAGAHYFLIGIGELLFLSVADVARFGLSVDISEQLAANVRRSADGANILQRVSLYRYISTPIPSEQIQVAGRVGEGIRNGRDQRIKLAIRVVEQALLALGEETLD